MRSVGRNALYSLNTRPVYAEVSTGLTLFGEITVVYYSAFKADVLEDLTICQGKTERAKKRGRDLSNSQDPDDSPVSRL